jgi:hypothetical protein
MNYQDARWAARKPVRTLIAEFRTSVKVTWTRMLAVKLKRRGQYGVYIRYRFNRT